MALTGIQLESQRYDPGLTYEQRSAVRKEERTKLQEERAKVSVGLNGLERISVYLWFSCFATCES